MNNLENEEFVKVLSENNRYRVELIIDDENQYAVRKRLVDLTIRDEFIAKAKMMYDLGQVGILKGFAKVTSINEEEANYTIEYTQGGNLAEILDKIDINRDKKDLQELELELNKRFTNLEVLGYACKSSAFDQFIVNSGGELIWYNYDVYPVSNRDKSNEPWQLANDMLQVFKDEREAKAEAARTEAEAARVKDKIETKKILKRYIIAVFILAFVGLLIFTPVINYTIAHITYDDISELTENYFVVKKRGKYGLLSSRYNSLLEPQYQHIYTIGLNNIFIIVEDGKQGLFVGDQIKISPTYDDITNLGYKYFRFKKDNKYGLRDISLEEIYPVKYDSINVFKNDYALLWNDSKVGLSINGSEISTISYDCIESIDDTFIHYRGENHIIYSIPDGKFMYTDADYIPFKQNGLYGYMNPVRTILINPIYSSAKPFKYGGAIVSKVNEGTVKYGIINWEDEAILGFNYEAVIDYDGKSSIIKRNDLYGVIDFNKRLESIYGYDYIERLGECYRVYKGSLYMTKDLYDNYRYEPTDLKPHLFNSSLDPWGYVNLFGETAIEPQYCEVSEFDEDGYAHAEVWGLIFNDRYIIDTDGNRNKR